MRKEKLTTAQYEAYAEKHPSVLTIECNRQILMDSVLNVFTIAENSLVEYDTFDEEQGRDVVRQCLLIPGRRIILKDNGRKRMRAVQVVVKSVGGKTLEVYPGTLLNLVADEKMEDAID